MKRLATILLMAVSSIPSTGQDTCETGTAEAYLEANNVRARILNNGRLFWKEGSYGYEVPNGSGHISFLGASLIIGGMHGNELRVTGAKYSGAEYWPGAIGAKAEACSRLDRIFSVTTQDFDQWNEDGIATSDMIEWPWQVGAPVTDGDGNPNNYDLAAGDLPELLGDQTLWWLMNDAGGIHENYSTNPLNIEVAATVFASNLKGATANTTFYRYQLTYHGTELLRGARISLFADPDLGRFTDDYMGADTTLGMAYVYNADNDDENDEDGGFNFGYGFAPPAVGIVFLEAPKIVNEGAGEGDLAIAGRSSYLSAMIIDESSAYIPANFTHPAFAFRQMQGKWQSGEVMTEGGNGHGFTDDTTTVMFPGEPGEYWSELNTNGFGDRNTPDDRRFVMSNGPFDLEPGESITFTFAIVWSRGSSNLDSVRKLKEDVAIIKQAAPYLLKPYYKYEPPETPDPDYVLGANGIYPNPASETATFRYSLPQPMHVRLEVFDVLGRRVFDGVDGIRSEGEYTAEFDVSGWPAGVYSVRLQLDHLSTTKTFTVVR